MAAIDNEGHERTAAAPEPGLRDGPLRVTEPAGPTPLLRVSGAVDLNSHDDWAQALRRAAPRRGALHLDLAELAFIDMRGVSLLVDLAQELPGGARIVVHRPPPCMLRMIEVLWPDGPDAITIEGGTR